ncbi:MAG: tetratricopeptide repeat protein [Candidatus Omnitrophica bacterium]|nr:tetratricopeptide repeat protein [Candidatus Omnitrophota bacterium]
MFDFTKAIEAGSRDPQVYVNRGAINAQKGNFTQAISDFRKAIEINSQYADAYYNRAVFYYQLKEYDRAWEDVYQAEKLGAVVNAGFINTLKQASDKGH